MFSKTFFSRMKHANDITILTGPGIMDETKLPKFNGQNLNSHRFIDPLINKKNSFLNNKAKSDEWLLWRQNELTKIKPNLAHYSIVDIEKKVANIHLITTCVDGMHQKSGIENVIELNGNVFNSNPNDGLPHIRWFDSDIDKPVINKAAESAAICEMFILIGVGDLEKEYESLPFLAKGNGCYMIEINQVETNFSRHCNEKFIGDIQDFLPKLAIIINKVF